MYLDFNINIIFIANIIILALFVISLFVNKRQFIFWSYNATALIFSCSMYLIGNLILGMLCLWLSLIAYVGASVIFENREGVTRFEDLEVKKVFIGIISLAILVFSIGYHLENENIIIKSNGYDRGASLQGLIEYYFVSKEPSYLLICYFFIVSTFSVMFGRRWLKK